MVTIKDVSELAQVSTSTVSRVICKNGIVSEKTRERVLEAIKELGYKPNILAQGLKNKRSNVIGMVVPDICSPFFGMMLGGVEQAVERAHMNLLVASGHADKKDEIKAIESLLGYRCDALILCIEGIETEEITESISMDLPVIRLGRSVDNCPISSVHLDNQLGGYLATQYLISQGHTDIVHITGPQQYLDSRHRMQGYKKALKEAGIPFRKTRVIEGNFTEEFGYNATLELLKRKLKYTAIFAGDDDIAAGVMEALQEKGIKVPDELSLIGFDDMYHSRYMSPKLTTIRQPIVEMGKKAGEIAIELIASGEKEIIDYSFEPELVVRSSVRAI